MSKLSGKSSVAERMNRAVELVTFMSGGERPSDLSLRLPPTVPSPPRNPKSKQSYPAPSLESICKGDDEKRKKEVANRIDTIWEILKSKTQQHQHPAACVALYKVAVFLHKVEDHQSVKASDWRRTLEARYGVQITEGIGKYQIEKPKSDVFAKAVKLVFNLFKAHYPGWTKQRDLPTVYQ